jgi:hypothetical protein
MHICLWSNWFGKNIHNGMNSLRILLFTTHLIQVPTILMKKGFCSQTGPNAATKENWGVNYRALNDLFDISRRRRSSLLYEIGVQMIEIYNEQVRDLLSSDGAQKKYPFFFFFFKSSNICRHLIII